MSTFISMAPGMLSPCLSNGGSLPRRSGQAIGLPVGVAQRGKSAPAGIPKPNIR